MKTAGLKKLLKYIFVPTSTYQLKKVLKNAIPMVETEVTEKKIVISNK